MWTFKKKCTVNPDNTKNEENDSQKSRTLNVFTETPNRRRLSKKKILVFVTSLLIVCSIFIIVYSTTNHINYSGNKALKFTKQALLNYFKRISTSKTISGIYVRHDVKSNVDVQKMLNIAGVSPGMITKDMPYYNSGKSEWNSFIEEVISNWNNQHLVRIEWWIGHPLRKIFSGNFIDDLKKWDDLTKNGSKLNKDWKFELDQISPHLLKLQSAGVVPILEIFPSDNDDVGWYSGPSGVNGSAKLYQITRDYLTRKHNLTSLIWNWTFNVISSDATNFEEFWPGSDYVDVVSVYPKDGLSMSAYEELKNLVGDKTLSMESLRTVPSVELLTTQPRWTWFTLFDVALIVEDYYNARRIKVALSSDSLIHKGNIEIFNDDN